MTIRGLTRWVMGGGIAVALCATTSLQAQVDTTRRDTTRARSTTRIPIRKESKGEVALPVTTPPRTDSIAMAQASQARNDSIMRADRARNDSIAAAERARTDSLALNSRTDSLANAARTDSLAKIEQARADSISRAEAVRTDSITKVDSVAGTAIVSEQNMPPAPRRRLPGAFYIGLAAGSNSPMGDLENLGYDSGLNVSMPIGWHNPSNILGFRLMLGYNQLNGASFASGGASPVILSNPDPKVYSAELNLNMRFPFNERRTSSVYLSGGGGVYMFRNFGRASALAGYLGNDVLDPDDSANESTINKWGVNGGAGLEFGIGTSSLFIESRIVNVFAGRDDEPNFNSVFGERGTSVRWVPLILGFTIR